MLLRVTVPVAAPASAASETLLGAMLTALFLLPTGVRYRVRGVPRWGDEGLRQLAHAAVPIVVAMTAYESRIPLERLFALQLPEGSLAQLSYADKIIMLCPHFPANQSNI